MALVTAAGPAAAQAPSDVLDLRVPERLVLGSDEGGEISARTPEGRGLRFFTNVGAIEGLETREGRTTAHYRLPTTHHSQVAIVVAATDDWSVVEWASIPLYGQPNVRFRFEARSDVIVRIGEEEFGPVRTNFRGEAHIQLRVPPGVHQATAVGTDRLGNMRRHTIELTPPPFSRVFALCPGTGEEFLVFALDPLGRAATSAAELELSASAGSLTAPRPRGAGMFAVPLRVEASVADASVVLSASVRGADSDTSSCRVSLEAEPPERLRVSLSRDAHAAGDERVVRVTIDVEYPGDARPMTVEAPQVVVDVGTIGPVERENATRYIAPWTLPASFGEQTTATLRASLAEPSELTGSAQLALTTAASATSLGVRVGFLTNFGKINGPFSFAEFSHRFIFGDAGGLALGAGAGFWAGWDARLDQSGVEQVDFEMWAVPLLGRVGYQLVLNDLELCISVIGGAVVTRTRLFSPASGEHALTRATWALGGSLTGGLRLGPGAFVVEAGYLHAPVEGSVQGNVAGLNLSLGYALRL